MTIDTNELLADFQFYDKYSRFNHDLGRRESWEEAVQRSVDYLKELSKNKLAQNDYDQIKYFMLNKKAFPSMRLFAMAGEAARRDNASIYNCSAVGIDSIEAISEVMALCMSGSGVGFSVENKYIKNLPVVAHNVDYFNPDANVFSIPDSAAGWVAAFSLGLRTWWRGYDIKFDYSGIRPAGTVLKTKGGRASGADPLKDLLAVSKDIIKSAAGRQLTSIEVHDLVTKIADCVVSGGVRRSALISLFDHGDVEMRHSKKHGWWKKSPQRANANNSVVVDRKLTKSEIANDFMQMHNSGGGEPGFMFRVNVNRMNPTRRKDRDDWLYNPCQPSFATVLTPNGIKTFGDIKVGDKIWGKDDWTTVVNKWKTGVKPVWKYRSSFGEFIGTENHRVVERGKKIEVQYAEKLDSLQGGLFSHGDLNPIDIMDGLVIGDGSIHKASDNLVHLYVGKNDSDYFDSEISYLLIKERTAAFSSSEDCTVYEIGTTIKHYELPRTYERNVPDRFYFGNGQKVRGFLRGIFSANGSALSNGTRVTLKQTSERLIRNVQTMLSAIGIRSYITINKPQKVEWNNGDYISKTSYDLNITTDRGLFVERVGFIQKYKNDAISIPAKTRRGSGIIQSVEHLGDMPVYDITVDNESHTYWTGGVHVSNCGEINLRGDGQMCNLSQAITRPDDTFQSLAQKVIVATMIGTIQSMATHFPYLRSIWKENCEEERLLGVDITGQMDAPHLFTDKNLEALKEIAKETNEIYAKQLGINRSVAVTCNKPSGNSSILFNTSPGLHSRWSDYYLRRVRVNASAPMRHVLEGAGMRLTPENGQVSETATTFVVEFPVKAPDGAITNGSRSAIEQLEWWKMNKLSWTEHNPSVTISYTDDEIENIISWMVKNQSIIGGLSFLPYNDHYYPLAPYEKITKEHYEELIVDVPDIDWLDWLTMYENDDNTTVAQELACFSGSCEI